MHDVVRTANLLGAVALAVNDAALAGAARKAGVSASGAAALVVLSASPGLGVTELGRRVGLSQPATARMVDTLQAEGLVARDRVTGRRVSVTLTAVGDRSVRTLLTARGTPLTEIIGVLGRDEQATLAELLGKLLAGLYERVGSADMICRLCDRGSCVRDAVCPVGQAERDRAGDGG
jgi:MarR family transcriptional regulator, negative regulator of the multidrug operon emrRAB